MPIHRDQSKKGRHIKLGGGWVMMKDIASAAVSSDAGGRVLTVNRKGKPPVIVRGTKADFLKTVLDREIGKD